MNSWKIGRQAAIFVALLVSAAALGAGGYALGSSTVSTDVRINARQLEDGRVELALEHDGERILPSRRYFPAVATVGRWLRTSPITIDVELSEPDTVLDVAAGPGLVYGEEAFGVSDDNPDVFYFHGDAGVNGQRTGLVLSGTTNNNLYDNAKLSIFCDHDQSSLWVNVEAGWDIAGDWHAAALNDYDGVAEAALGTVAEREWSHYGLATYDDSVQSSGEYAWPFFVEIASNERWLVVALPRYSNDIIATFDMQGLFTTPAQTLMVNCLDGPPE